MIIPPETKQANEQHRQPGTLLEQFVAIGISLHLADQRGTTAEMQWTESQAEAREIARTCFTSDKPVNATCSDAGRLA